MGKNHRKKLGQSLGKWQRIIAAAVITLASTAVLKAQPTLITGTVSDSESAPLVGVSVVVKGTTTGATTDLSGAFSIRAEAGQTLMFSSVGYVTQEAAVSGGAPLLITMEEDKYRLDEVVVIGYGVQKKKLVTGATVQVRGEDLQKLNTTTPLQAMQGQTPGVSIISNSGQPGADMKVTIRGLGTTGSSGPLYLIDGVGGDINNVNPADIVSIDILKDAASAAIYGAQAANGVILVTTKSGREGTGKAQVSFDAYYGVQNAARKTKMLNAEQYKVIMDEQAVNSGGLPYTWASFSDIEGVNTDWIDAMFKDNALTQSYTVGFTGGSATSTYAISLGYFSQEGIVGGKEVSNLERYNFRVNTEHKLLKNLLTVGERVSFVYRPSTGIGVGNQYNNTLRGAFNTSPLSPIYSDNNIYDSPYNDTYNSSWYKGDGNPYGSMMTGNSLSQNRTFSGNIYAEIEPVAKLKVRTQLGTVFSASESRSFRPLYQFSEFDHNNVRTRVTQNMNQGTTLTWANTASYDFSLDEHMFNVLAGMESSLSSGTSVGAERGSLKEGFDTWEYAYIDNATSTSNDDGLFASGSPWDETRTVSYFGRIGYSFHEKYLLNATLRADGSSRFAKGNRFGYFPSVSAGWVASSESFMEALADYVNYAKLRASWGQVGNQNIPVNRYLAPISISGNNYLFGTTNGSAAQADFWGSYPSRLGNPGLKWETSEQINIGIDATIIKHLSLNFDYYIKTTKDWLVQAPVLATVGTGAPYINGGDVKNTGVEVALTWSEKIAKDFRYSVGVNGAYNKNTVGKIPNADGIIHGSTNQLGYDNSPEFYRAQDGHAIGYFWGYQTDGLFQNQAEIDAWKAAGNGILQADVKPGDVKFLDLNHDGEINDDDKADLGNGLPSFTFGFNIDLAYKGFDFSIYANGAAGNQLVQSYRNHGGNVQANYTESILDRWTGEGTSNKTPRVTNTNVNWQFSDLFLQKGDYLRINNITVGYDFAKLINYAAIGQCRLYFQVQNPFTFTKYDGMDPEVGYGTQGWVSGIDLGYYPRPRTMLCGVNIKF